MAEPEPSLENGLDLSDLTLVQFLGATLLAACISPAEFLVGWRVIDGLRYRPENAVPVAAMIYFAFPFLLLALSGVARGSRGPLRFLALAFLLGAVMWGLMMYVFALGMGAMRFG